MAQKAEKLHTMSLLTSLHTLLLGTNTVDTAGRTKLHIQHDSLPKGPSTKRDTSIVLELLPHGRLGWGVGKQRLIGAR